MAVMMDVLFGPYRGQRIMMPDADAAQAIADGWAIDPHAPPIEPPFDLSVRENADRVHEAARVGSAMLRDLDTTLPPPPLVLASLSPAQATIGDPDLAMHVTREGFTAACIHFNGGDTRSFLRLIDDDRQAVDRRLAGPIRSVEAARELRRSFTSRPPRAGGTSQDDGLTGRRWSAIADPMGNGSMSRPSRRRRREMAIDPNGRRAKDR